MAEFAESRLGVTGRSLVKSITRFWLEVGLLIAAIVAISIGAFMSSNNSARASGGGDSNKIVAVGEDIPMRVMSPFEVNSYSFQTPLGPASGDEDYYALFPGTEVFNGWMEVTNIAPLPYGV